MTSAGPGPIITVEGLRKRYGDVAALNGVSFTIDEGEIFGILGPNGSGKTTTVEIIEGMRRADSGRVTVAGIDAARDPAAVKAIIGVQLQSNAFIELLSLGELLKLFGAIFGARADPAALLGKVDLADRQGARYRHLSGGQQQRFAVAAALVGDPRIVFLDEPTTGLDPHARRRMWDLIASWRGEGRTVLLTTHYMEEAEALCDRLAIMDAGRIIALDTPAALIQDLLDRGSRTAAGGARGHAGGRIPRPDRQAPGGGLTMRLYPPLYLAWSMFKTMLREPVSLLWAFVLPLMLIIPFGLIDFGGAGALDVGLADHADNAASRELAARLEGDPAINLTTGSEAEERAALQDGRRDLIVILSASFSAGGALTEAHVLYHADREREARIGDALLRAHLHGLIERMTGTDGTLSLTDEQVDARKRRYRDFLTPGVIAFAIMQIGVSGLSLEFVGMKRTGALRRLRATPLNPAALILAQGASRLLLMILQVALLTSIAVFGLDIEFEGNFFSMTLAALLGGMAFMTLGFAVSGWTSTERAALPLSNAIVLVLLFLSGVFFSRDIPGVVGTVSDYPPLTFMVDAMRGIALDGNALGDHWRDLLGMAAWLVAGVVTARLAFRWE